MCANIAAANLRDYSLKNVSTVDGRRIIDMGVSNILSVIAIAISLVALAFSVRWKIQSNRQKQLSRYEKILDFLTLLSNEHDDKARQARLNWRGVQKAKELCGFEALYGKKLKREFDALCNSTSGEEYLAFLEKIEEKYNKAIKSAYKTW